jgi:hypothetical protein
MALLSSIGDRPHLPISERRDNPSLRVIKGRGRLSAVKITEAWHERHDI